MALDFSIRTLEAQPAVTIRQQAKMDQLASLMGAAFGEIMGVVQAAGSSPAGMPFTRYHEMHGQSVDFACGIPVTSAVGSSGRATADELPAGRVATVTHVGPYDQLKTTWDAVMGWVQSEGLTPNGLPWEVYVDDPTTVEPAKLRTEIFVPVR